MSKYDKEIEELSLKLQKLRNLKEEEEVANFPDITGKYYHPASTTMIKVAEVTDWYKDYGEAVVEGLIVRLEGESAYINTDSDAKIDLRDEVKKEQFLEFYNRAKEVIESNLCK